jgi:hypothetical protein
MRIALMRNTAPLGSPLLPGLAELMHVTEMCYTGRYESTAARRLGNERLGSIATDFLQSSLGGAPWLRIFCMGERVVLMSTARLPSSVALTVFYIIACDCSGLVISIEPQAPPRRLALPPTRRQERSE